MLSCCCQVPERGVAPPAQSPGSILHGCGGLTVAAPQVTTHNLERVRRIKSRMVRLKTRGETIKEVLEKYLDDDSDMKDMNLTAKCAQCTGGRGSPSLRPARTFLKHLGTAGVSFSAREMTWGAASIFISMDVDEVEQVSRSVAQGGGCDAAHGVAAAAVAGCGRHTRRLLPRRRLGRGQRHAPGRSRCRPAFSLSLPRLLLK